MAKVDDADLLASVDALISELEGERGPTVGSVAVSPRIESARLRAAGDEIAAAPRITLLGLGEADLVADLGLEPGPDGLELLPARFAAVSASAAAGLRPLVGPASTNYRHLETLTAGTAALRRLGFSGRAAIHPAQVPAISIAFTPTAAQAAGDWADPRYLPTRLGRDGLTINEAVARSARQS